MWFMRSGRLLLLQFDILCEGGQELGSLGADDKGCWMGAVVDDELEEIGRQSWGEEERLCVSFHCGCPMRCVRFVWYALMFGRLFPCMIPTLKTKARNRSNCSDRPPRTPRELLPIDQCVLGDQSVPAVAASLDACSPFRCISGPTKRGDHVTGPSHFQEPAKRCLSLLGATITKSFEAPNGAPSAASHGVNRQNINITREWCVPKHPFHRHQR